MWQVDAFTERPFAGNPAAVSAPRGELSAGLMQAIAAENNLSETAFLVARDGASGTGTTDGAPGGSTSTWDLRWFTPTVEVDLCGHATLASAHVVFAHLAPGATTARFSTRSGDLVVTREDDGVLRMDLPTDPRREVAAPDGLRAILGAEPVAVLGGATWIVVLEDAAQVASLRPDVVAIGALDPPYLNVTAPGEAGEGVDFVSRFFAPGAGIEEDPATGSAHCALTPWWAARLGRSRLRARQVSTRGGDLDCELAGDRVVLRGRCAEVFGGELRIDGP